MLQLPRPSVPQSLSIVINNYNYERFVGEAIESALGQTRPANVVVVDDGSTDNSASVIGSFGDKVQATFKANGGQASALNAGLALTRSDAVLFLDSDDVLEANAVETLLAGWRSGVVMAHYPMTLIGADGESRGVYPDPPSNLADGDVTNELITAGKFARTVTSGMAFARWALDKVIPLPETEFAYCADGYLLQSVPFYGPVQRFDTCLARYRQHASNFSRLSATRVGLAASFRKKMSYAMREFAVARDRATTLGLSVAPDLGESDADFLSYRLFSLLLEPQNHPIAGDRISDLLPRYAAARWATPWQAHRRALAIAMATSAALGPRESAVNWILWMHDSSSRPEWMRTLARRTKAQLGR